MTSTATKRGAPLKSEHEKRTKHAETWLSPGEHEHLLAVAGKRKPADYLRDLALRDWSPSAAQQSGKRGRPPQAIRTQFRVTFAEKQHLAAMAAKADMPESDYLRLAILAASGYDAEKNVLRLEVRPGLGKKLAELAAARNQTIAEYVLAQAEAEPLGATTNTHDVDAELLMKLDQVKHALDRIGNNVNQIAKSKHVGRELPGLGQATAQELSAERRRAAEILEEVAARYAW